MGSLALSAEGRKALLSDLQAVYDSHRFLDAYTLSAEYWNEATSVEDLSAEEMIFAGRLASRLGGFRLSRYMYRAARDREPDLPIVRYFTRHLNGPKHLLLDELLEFEKNPDLGGEGPESTSERNINTCSTTSRICWKLFSGITVRLTEDLFGGLEYVGLGTSGHIRRLGRCWPGSFGL